MTVNVMAIRQRRDAALKEAKLPMLVRKLLIDDFEVLLKEVEKLRQGANGANGAADNPSGENGWQLETYTARRKLKSGAVVEYEYKREWCWKDGKKVMRHVKSGRNTGRNGRKSAW